MLIRIACIVLLVFTTIAPSIATANTGISNSNSITIDAGSEQRTILDAHGYVLLGTNKSYPMHGSDIGNGKVQLIYSEETVGSTTNIQSHLFREVHGRWTILSLH